MKVLRYSAKISWDDLYSTFLLVRYLVKISVECSRFRKKPSIVIITIPKISDSFWKSKTLARKEF